MINADLSRRIVEQTSSMAWQASPSASVRRKRLYHVGTPEAGRVTSIVEYLPGATFRGHDHPEGEEILVLQGTFSDHTGDWGAGSWLLNPEGFHHAPWSEQGCLLYVKLRQYTGDIQRAATTDETIPKQGSRLLFDWQSVTTQIVRLQDGDRLTIDADAGAEGLILAGEASLWEYSLGMYDWFRVPPGESASLASGSCTLYLQENAIASLAQTISARAE